jgi:hypothetical protein
VDDFLWELNYRGYYTVGYSDDIAILIKGKCPQTVSEVLHPALHTVQQWCKRTKLSINPNKTVVMSFTRRNTKGLREPILSGEMIQLSSGVKYLGITLEKRLTWKSNWIRSLVRPTKPSGHAEAHFGKLGV